MPEQKSAWPVASFVERYRAAKIADTAEHDRAERGDDDRAAEQAKKIQRAGRGAELMRLHGVLHDDGAGRIHRPDRQAEQTKQSSETNKR